MSVLVLTCCACESCGAHREFVVAEEAEQWADQHEAVCPHEIGGPVIPVRKECSPAPTFTAAGSTAAAPAPADGARSDGSR